MAALTDDSEIRYHVHPRYVWLLMVRPVLALLILLFVLDFAYIYLDGQKAMPRLFTFDILLLDVLIAILVLVPSCIWFWLGYMNFYYMVRKDELIVCKGIIQKRHNSIPYNKIRNVQRLQSPLERIFGLCTISIETAEVSLEFPDTSIPGMRNSRELPDIILNKTHAKQDEGKDLGDTMREILLQLKELNKRGQDHDDRELEHSGQRHPKPR
jgi:uncharacterized membrane protein YdbT with pleckstrin-like domain